MCADDDLAIRIAIDDLVRPLDGVGRHVDLEVDDQEIDAAGREQLVVVLVEALDLTGLLAEPAAVPRVAGQVVAARREVLVEEVRGHCARGAEVVVAWGEVVRDAGVVEDVHRGVCTLELDLVRVEAFGDVTELADEDHVEVVRIVDDPLRLLVERARSIGIVHVVLGVRDHDDREVLGGRRPGRSTVERCRQLAPVGIADRRPPAWGWWTPPSRRRSATRSSGCSVPSSRSTRRVCRGRRAGR